MKAYKINTIELARHHRKTCKDGQCNVSLIMLRIMAEKAGVEFTEEESKEFI